MVAEIQVILIRLENDMQKVPMTPEGYKRLQERLKQFKTVDKPANIRAIEEARAHGDLRENAEYHAAKEQQGLIESQIRDIETALSLAQIIDPAKMEGDKVVFGATVTLLDLETDEKITYRIVGKYEIDLSNGDISVESPIARSLIGKSTNDEIKVSTPKGVREFEIIEILYK